MARAPPPLPPPGGIPPAGMPAPPAPAKTSGLAIASLVLGILACPLSCLSAIPGLICGIVGLVRIRASETAATRPRLGGHGLALAGILLNAVFPFVTPVMIGLLLPAVQAARELARRVQCMNNVTQIGLGMHTFASTQRDSLPAAIVDADGSVHTISDGVDPEVFKALLTRSGGDILPAEFWSGGGRCGATGALLGFQAPSRTAASSWPWRATSRL